jgi:homoserine kinase
MPTADAGAATRVHVRVPCSTSNLGAGFDCVGIALDRWLEVEMALAPAAHGSTLARAGALAALDAAGVPAGDDLLVRGALLACAATGRTLPPGLAVRATSDIPVARGLGSSAAALVAGALAADALLGLGLGAAGAAALAATEEGHPDNAAPIALGGAVLGIPAGAAGRGWHFARLDVHAEVGVAIAVPAFETSTKVMRAALPATLPYADAVATGGKAAALVRGLATADAALLAHALDDVLHVPYRRALLPGYDAVTRAAREAGAWGATISGAGSTLIALAPRARAGAVAAAMAGTWRQAGVAADGATPAIAAGPELAVH